LPAWLLTIFTNWSSAYFVCRYFAILIISAVYVPTICNRPLPPPVLVTCVIPMSDFRWCILYIICFFLVFLSIFLSLLLLLCAEKGNRWQ
jgi:hypothetical protein